MKRAKHSLSHYKLATFDMGQLVPVGCYEVLPGDSVRQATSMLLRVSPLMAPVMHPVSVRVHHWFVPYRLLWDGWEDFITGGSDGLGGSSGAFPYINSGSGFAAGGLADHFGIPPGINAVEVSALPFRAYAMIFNEFYRDQDLVTALAMSTGSGADSTTNVLLARIAWEKDYFTSARPWTQRGPEVVLPLGDVAPVKARDVSANMSSQMVMRTTTSPSGYDIPTVLTSEGFTTDAVVADLSAATAAGVTEIRRAFALQRYAEARAQYGARYSEYLRYLGVKSSDARLQRPEYLGGGKQMISFSEVLATAQNGSTPTINVNIGEMRGHGIAAVRSRRFLRFFEEHGCVITLASVRPKAMYNDGVHRMWSRRTKEDFWQKELEQIGQQEVYRNEVYADATVPLATFGYQDRYAEYRHHPSTVSGEFRTSIMNDWHLGRIFGAEPTLNSDFVTCTPSKRVHADQTNNTLWCLFNHQIQARRMVGKRTIGRIL